jgi:hypothetical protein
VAYFKHNSGLKLHYINGNSLLRIVNNKEDHIWQFLHVMKDSGAALDQFLYSKT